MLNRDNEAGAEEEVEGLVGVRNMPWRIPCMCYAGFTSLATPDSPNLNRDAGRD